MLVSKWDIGWEIWGSKWILETYCGASPSKTATSGKRAAQTSKGNSQCKYEALIPFGGVERDQRRVSSLPGRSDEPFFNV